MNYRLGFLERKELERLITQPLENYSSGDLNFSLGNFSGSLADYFNQKTLILQKNKTVQEQAKLETKIKELKLLFEKTNDRERLSKLQHDLDTTTDLLIKSNIAFLENSIEYQKLQDTQDLRFIVELRQAQIAFEILKFTNQEHELTVQLDSFELANHFVKFYELPSNNIPTFLSLATIKVAKIV